LVRDVTFGSLTDNGDGRRQRGKEGNEVDRDASSHVQGVLYNDFSKLVGGRTANLREKTGEWPRGV